MRTPRRIYGVERQGKRSNAYRVSEKVQEQLDEIATRMTAILQMIRRINGLGGPSLPWDAGDAVELAVRDELAMVRATFDRVSKLLAEKQITAADVPAGGGADQLIADHEGHEEHKGSKLNSALRAPHSELPEGGAL